MTVTVNCENCDTGIEKYPSDAERRDKHFCSKECQHNYTRGENHHNYKSEKEYLEEFVCDECGKKSKKIRQHINKNNFCSKKCYHKYYSGKDSPHWNGGVSNSRRYGSNWKRKRELCLQRDYYRCRVCNISEDNCKEKYNCPLQVHHRTPIRYFDEPEEANYLENLLTLCPRCHGKLEREISL